jgi:hypothetical protein
MTSDAFIHCMRRYEEDVQEHPDVLAKARAEEALITELERLDRALTLLILALQWMGPANQSRT